MENLQVKQVTISSIEVAEMLGIKHHTLLEKLEGTKKPDGTVKQVGIIPVLTNQNFLVSDYFIEDSYKDDSGKTNKCYQFTKLGCDFIANKFTGEKGIIFTAKYVKRFHEMAEYIKEKSVSSATAFDDYIHKTFKFKSQDVEVLKIDDQLLFNMFHIGRCLEMRDEIIKSFAKAIGKEQLIRFKLDDVYNYKLHNGDCFLTLSGVYRLIFLRPIAIAEQFTNWIAEEVLFNMINTPASSVQALDVKSLEAVNEAVKLILPSVEAAGMEPVHRSRLLKQLYGKVGITVPTLKIEQKNLTYTRTMIAEKLGVYSKGNNPHASAISAILKKLTIDPTNIVLTSYDKNGHTGFDYQYKTPVVEQVKQWLEENGYPNTVYDNGRMYNVNYEKAGVLA